MSLTSVKLSIIIPAYNEADRILPTLQEIESFIKQQPYKSEVIIVNDCSRDQTETLVQEFIKGKENFALLKNKVNLGKGASVNKGIEYANGEFKLFSDADHSTPIDCINSFWPIIKSDENKNGSDVIFGSRRVKGAKLEQRQPIYREASGRIFSLLVRLLAVPGYLDTQCGFKLFTAAAAKEIFRRQTIWRFGFDVELLYVAKKILSLKVTESPITWKDSPNTKVNLLRDSTNMFLDLIRIRWNDFRGQYR